MATTSACAVGSLVRVTRFVPSAMMRSSLTIRAANGPPIPERTFSSASAMARSMKTGDMICCSTVFQIVPSGRNTVEQQIMSPDFMERAIRSEEHTSELQSHLNLVCRLLLEQNNRTENILHRNFTRRQVAIQNRVASNIGISQSTFSVKVLNLFSRSRRKTNKRKSKHSAMLRNKETRHRMFIGLLISFFKMTWRPLVSPLFPNASCSE